MNEDEHDIYECPDYPEHDYKVFDEGEGWTVYHCQRCGAELHQEDEDDQAD